MVRTLVPTSMLAWFAKAPHSARGWIYAIACLSAAGALLVGAVAGWYSWHEQKLRLGGNLISTSRALAELADQQLTQAGLVAHTLAVSGLLQGNVQQFQQQAIRGVRPFGYFVILTKAGDLHELVDTRVPAGAALPNLPKDWAFTGSDTGVKPVTRDADGHWAAAMQLRGPANTYVVTVGIPVEQFQHLIDKQKLPSRWSPVILDQNWTIVARGIDPEKYDGQQGANREVLDLPGPDRLYEADILEGYRAFVARSASRKYGWTAAVAVPQALLLKEFIGPALTTAVAGFLISLLAVGGIVLFSVRLLRDVRLLSAASGQLARGEFDAIPNLSIRELEDIAAGVREAGLQIKTEERLRKLAVEELAHRLRNKVATLQAIVSLQLSDHPQQRDKITAKLGALSATDQLIIDAQGRGAKLGDVIKTELQPYGASRTDLDGPDVFLEPKLALTMTLVFHELATNAAKYGALSNNEGHLSVSWSTTQDRLNIDWRERGGPPVQEPAELGFGGRLIGSALHAFQGSVQSRFERCGLVVKMTASLAKSAAAAANGPAAGS